MEPIFREANAADANAIQKLFPHWKNVAKRIAQENRQRFVAELEGKVVGHVAVEFHSGTKEHIATMQSIIVLPEHRGKGIGIGLEKYAIAQLAPKIVMVVGRVSAENRASLVIQKKLGFKKYGFLEKGSKNGKKLEDAMLFVKRLK